MDVREIVEQWLRENGYDGLSSQLGCCMCELGEQFMPSECEGVGDCEPRKSDAEGSGK